MPADDSTRIRLDAALVKRGLESSRERAKQRILAGEVLVNGRQQRRPSFLTGEEDRIECKGEGLVYVGRGGCKLEKAVSGRFDLDGATALDVGASTGGFTDCLLQNGAARVFAVDVGHGQLHPSLAADPRVVNLEGTDIRDQAALLRAMALRSVDFCAVDVSFISLAAVLPAVLPFLRQGADLVCLIKPQFEAGRAAVGKRGIVKDPRVHRRVLAEFTAFTADLGLTLRELTYSPITGGDGNIEFLAVLRYDSGNGDGQESRLQTQIAAIVAAAHQALKGDGSCGLL